MTSRLAELETERPSGQADAGWVRPDGHLRPLVSAENPLSLSPHRPPPDRLAKNVAALW